MGVSRETFEGKREIDPAPVRERRTEEEAGL
jgi:hypothetical protein